MCPSPNVGVNQDSYLRCGDPATSVSPQVHNQACAVALIRNRLVDFVRHVDADLAGMPAQKKRVRAERARPQLN